jgi:RimJ/RimL family protein N-acetyltransferase
MTRNHGVVATARLDVVPLSPPLVAALVAGDLSRAAALAPFPLDAGTFAGDEYVLALRHDQLTADPSEEPWLYRAAVLRDTGAVVARAGFHAPPDDRGTVEIGYSVAPAYRRQGLATELAAGLLAWARGNGARRCLASVRPDNVASLRTIGRLGFVRTGEEVDEIDGLEWVFTLELDRALRHPVAPR